MHRTLLLAGIIGIAITALADPAAAGWRDRYEVQGVEEDDMLKMRAGPGTGYKVILGLPNGTRLRVTSCEQTGGTRWCKVSLDGAPGLRGYVSWAYLRQM
ncbi:SH3 domain-containing protein [Tropicibacter oceani]|uniref:SH3 domain-containing protein n=1 Tax=Tropicibacter oceani TaxID=3058420 RepID=A0ABY8QEC1_9RHOB|nr:SH3 domain-containing protein [Tropicibacter oceani]WGW02860.1 SH3 domain-containing protein [Tropicibacter oceani]